MIWTSLARLLDIDISCTSSNTMANRQISLQKRFVALFYLSYLQFVLYPKAQTFRISKFVWIAVKL